MEKQDFKILQKVAQKIISEEGMYFEEEDNDISFSDGGDDYSADELRELIDYVYSILDMDDDGEANGSVGEIGLDLIYEYADVFPVTVINQIVADLKEMFEIEDTLAEHIMVEGFVKQAKGALAIASRKNAAKYYKKNKAKIKAANKKWRKSSNGKKTIALHKKLVARVGTKKGFRLTSR